MIKFSSFPLLFNDLSVCGFKKCCPTSISFALFPLASRPLILGSVCVCCLLDVHLCMMCASSVQLMDCSDPWTVACQAPLSMDFPGKNTSMACHLYPQGIFPMQELNLHLLHGQVDSSHLGKP